MEYVKALAVFIIALAAAWFGYLESVGFSAAFPVPASLEEYARSTGDYDNIYYWLFMVVTTSAPYAIIVAIVSFLSGRFSFIWLAPVAFLLALYHLRAFAYGATHWWLLVVISVLLGVWFSIIGHHTSLGTRTRKRARC